MADLTTKYMGLELRNPLIVGSSGLTRSLDGLKKAEAAGAGAVVLKSVFEEQIEAQVAGLVEESRGSLGHSEAMDYITRYGRDNEVEEYLDLIRSAEGGVSIPVIASIHCSASGDWTSFAQQVEKAGADAIELNLFVLPCDPERDGRANEEVCFDIARAVTEATSLPVSLKLGAYFSGLSHMLVGLSRTKVAGLVLFNRFYRLDFDIDDFSVVPAGAFSAPEEIVVPLRWISILSGQVDCDLCATTGIHDGTGIVKQLLAGASAVQTCSVLYKKGVAHLTNMLEEVTVWMEKHGFGSVSEFQGKMSRDKSEDPAAYERVQFMKRSVEIA